MPSNNATVGRWWIITMSVAENPNWQPSLPEGVAYAKGQQEEGASGFIHWQMVIHMARNSRRAAVVRAFPGCHAELTRSQAALAYVWKDDTAVAGTRFELGAQPVKRHSKPDWDRVWEAAKAGDLDSIPASIKVQNWSNLKRIQAEYSNPQPRPVPQVKVYWGVTGSGKSHRSFEEAGPEAYVKSASNKWWDGYRGQDCVVIDEFVGLIDITHLLRWFDRYPMFVEIKGGTTPLKAHRFWLTSNVDPDKWYPNANCDQHAALMRRLTITHMTEQYIRNDH